MYSLSPSGWLLAILCGFVVGMAKSGIPGLGSLAVPMLASVLPARTATGALLPLLVTGDAIGAAYFRRSCNLRLLRRLLPISIGGIILGWWLLGFSWMDDLAIRYVTAVIILVLLILNQCKGALQRMVAEGCGHPWCVWLMVIFFGLLTGVTTMLANAAGPVALIYLLAMGLPKDEFIGTNAWFFLVLNWIKVPFMVGRGMINAESLLFNLKLVPALLLGAAAGILLSRKLTNQAFRRYITILTAIAAALLFLPPGKLTELLRLLLGTGN
jgi:uncharacterized protein